MISMGKKSLKAHHSLRFKMLEICGLNIDYCFILIITDQYYNLFKDASEPNYIFDRFEHI